MVILTCKLTGFELVVDCVGTTWFFNASSQEFTSAFVPHVTIIVSIMFPGFKIYKLGL